MQIEFEFICKRCDGTGWIPNSIGLFISSSKCGHCCKHNKGYWQLLEHYGEDNGKWCCLNGCGYTIDDPPLNERRVI